MFKNSNIITEEDLVAEDYFLEYNKQLYNDRILLLYDNIVMCIGTAEINSYFLYNFVSEFNYSEERGCGWFYGFYNGNGYGCGCELDNSYDCDFSKYYGNIGDVIDQNRDVAYNIYDNNENVISGDGEGRPILPDLTIKQIIL